MQPTRYPTTHASPADPSATADDDTLRRARRRVDAKIGWGVHALVYVCVNLGLLGWNLVLGGARWHVFPLAGWGLGLAIHGLVVLLSLRGEGLRERLLAQEIQRLQARR